MKATGIIRKIDDLGRLVIPMEIRRIQDISPGTPMELFVHDNGDMTLRKYEPGCHACGESGGELRTVGNVRLCGKCIKALGCGDGCKCKSAPAKGVN